MKDFAAAYSRIKKELSSSNRPIFFFDDDPDGLSSFLLLYRYVKRGKGIIVKSTPRITLENVRKVKDYGADKVFVLDLPMMDQGFIDEAPAPVVWIDHHVPQNRKGIFYFNPRSYEPEAYFPVSLIAYNTVMQDIWIAAAGVAGDFLVPPFLKDFKKQYPGYVGRQKTPEGILFETKLGTLVNVLSLILKGPTTKVMQCVKILTRIQHPDEILNQTTSQGRFIFKYYQKHKKEYNLLLAQALKHYNPQDALFVFVYPSSKLSLTADLALELIHRYPDKVVVVAREKNNEMKISIRSRGKMINEALSFALEGIEGYGGGHEYACGANVVKKDFNRFLSKLRLSLNH